MKSGQNNPRRDFIKKSLITAATLTTSPGLIFGKAGNIDPINRGSSQILSNQNGLITVALIGNVFWMVGHQYDIATKFFIGKIPTDDGMVKSDIKIVSMYIDQIGANDFGTRMAAMNGAVNLSTNDGWICEFVNNGNNGFVVPPADYANMHVEEQDNYDLNKLYEILENEILPLYYNDYETWRQIVKNGMRDVQVAFDSNRMVEEYYEILYK